MSRGYQHCSLLPALVAAALLAACGDSAPAIDLRAVVDASFEGALADAVAPAQDGARDALFADLASPDLVATSHGSVAGVSFYQKGAVSTTFTVASGGKTLLADRELKANYCKSPPNVNEVLAEMVKVQYGLKITGIGEGGSFIVDGSKVTAVWQKVSSVDPASGVQWTVIQSATSGTIQSTVSGDLNLGTAMLAGSYDVSFPGGQLKGAFSGRLCWNDISYF